LQKTERENKISEKFKWVKELGDLEKGERFKGKGRKRVVWVWGGKHQLRV